MKTSRLFLALSILVAASSCNKTEKLEPQAPGNLVTITAILPDDDAVKGAGEKNCLSWTWNPGDKITVIGETTEVFRIKDGFTPKKAEFVGIAVKGESFTILYPGQDIEEADWSVQEQKGNNNLDHLQYQAALTGVNQYTRFSFNEDWAEEHGGTLKQTGVLKLSLDLPETITAPEKVMLSADEPLFFSGNGEEARSDRLELILSECTVNDGKLVAWLTTSWNEAGFEAGTTLYVTINGNGMSYFRDVLMPDDATLKTGKVNLFTLVGGGWADEAVNAHYAGGRGTRTSPWIVNTTEQLCSLNGDLATGSVRYVKLDADLDLTGVEWTPLNGLEGNRQYVVFDGAGHTISQLTAPLFEVLAGSVKDLVIDGSEIDGGASISGILANTIGKGVEVSIDNVDIKNSNLISSNTAGGIIGQSDVEFTISDCDVEKTSVRGSISAGLVGFANCKIDMNKCSFTDGKVSSSARYAGGILGSVASYESVISDCLVKDAVVDSEKDRIGGMIGQLQQKAKLIGSKTENVSVRGTQNIGGLVGCCYGTVENCSASGAVTSINTNNGNYAANLGGIAGYLQYEKLSKCSAAVTIDAKGANMGGLVGNFQSGLIEMCSATGDVTGTYRYIGGLVGIADRADTHGISNSYASGNVSGNSYVGGFIGGHNNGTLNVSNCYASGNVTASGFAAGGLIGHMKMVTGIVEKCAAWAPAVTATSIGDSNWSSACVVGVAFPTCTLTDNYRNPDMALKAFWVPAADFQHANVSADTPLVKRDGNPTTATGLGDDQDGYPQFPYHGKVEAGKTLSALANDILGWSSDVWDFSTDTPTLK